jgi:hypothetical protein
MDKYSSLPFRRIALIAGLAASCAGVAHAEPIIGLTTDNSLVSFDSATPGTVNSIGAITGLTAGDTIVGIDRRPQLGPNNGRLYGLGVNLAVGTARVYLLDTNNAAATLVSSLAADPADATAPTPYTTVSGTSFGVDFNPTVDRLRIVSNTGQNLRMNVDNGLVQLDVPLAYQAGDPNLGDAPVVVGVAYANNVGGALSTTLRGVDIGQDPDTLVIHTNPNGGTLMTSLALPFNSTGDFGYDISGLSGTPYFSATAIGGLSSSLFAAGPGGVTLVGTIGGDSTILDIAAPVGLLVPEPASLLLSVGGLATLLALRLRRRRV